MKKQYSKYLICIISALMIFTLESLINNQAAAGTSSAINQLTQQTINESNDIQNRAFTEAEADRIIREIITPKMTDDEKEKAIHDYIIKNKKYDEQNHKRVSYSPYGVLIVGCSCQTNAKITQMLCRKAGLPCLIINGEAYSLGKWVNHAWNLIQLNGKWYHLDTSWDDPSPYPGVQYKYYNLTDQEIGTDHRWDNIQYPIAINHYDNLFTMDLIDKIALKINPNIDLNNPTETKQFYSTGIIIIVTLLISLIIYK